MRRVSNNSAHYASSCGVGAQVLKAWQCRVGGGLCVRRVIDLQTSDIMMTIDQHVGDVAVRNNSLNTESNDYRI